nr:hypothetical protein [Tanacetum cinerariifolium]
MPHADMEYCLHSLARRLANARKWTFSDYDNICNIGPSVLPKRQCVRRSSSVTCRGPESHVGPSVCQNIQDAGQLNSVPYHGQGLEVSGFPDVGLSVSPKRRIQLSSSSCPDQGWPTSGILVAVNHQLLSQSTHGDNVNIQSDASGEQCDRADYVIGTDALPNRSLGTQQRNTWSHNRRGSTIGRDSLQ